MVPGQRSPAVTPADFLLLAPVLFGALFWVATTVAVVRFMRSAGNPAPPEASAQAPPFVSLLKPVCGLEKRLYENLATACRQHYGAYEVIFAVQDPADPALPLLRRIRSDFPRTRIKIVVNDHRIGANGKVNNLYHAVEQAHGDIIAVSDSDMHLDPDYLGHLAAPFMDRRTGIVCALYQARQADNLYEALELLSYNADFVPALLFAYLSKSAVVCPGATMAIRREVLDAVGGLAPLADYFVEDFELGRRVTAAGHRIRLIAHNTGMSLDLASFGQWWRHQVYWDQNTKSVHGLGFFFTVLVRGVPFALLYALVGGPYGWAVPAASIGLRLLTGLANALALKDAAGARRIGLLPVRD
ncbi:MAG: glycosyltransferase, partial [Desulfatitalea sp.]|nr:glycosyltransferase [Desulfatitalea sp.]